MDKQGGIKSTHFGVLYGDDWSTVFRKALVQSRSLCISLHKGLGPGERH